MKHHSVDSVRRMHRRRLLGGAVATIAGVGLGLPKLTTRAQSSSVASASYGVAYDTGTEWWEGTLTREVWSDAILEHEMDVIANQLHSAAVWLFGSDLDRLERAAELAAAQGMQTWVQPMLISGSKDDTRAQLVDMATRLEAIRAGGATTTLVTGSNLTVMMEGILDGSDYDARFDSLYDAYDNNALGEVTQELNDFLGGTIDAIREVYDGAMTYNAATWEWASLDWSRFDYLSTSGYRDEDNRDTYEDDIAQMQAVGKPVVISEFGCATFEGASDLGVLASNIIDWTVDPPEIDGDYVRSESEQADTVLELLGIFEEKQLAGAFVYTFIEDYTYSEDPTYDLDMASFGIVKVLPAGSRGSDETAYWEPKEAFSALAERWSS